MVGLHGAPRPHQLPAGASAQPLGLGFRIVISRGAPARCKASGWRLPPLGPSCTTHGAGSAAGAMGAAEDAPPSCSQPCSDNGQGLQRRSTLVLGALAACSLAGAGPAQASKLPEAVDRGWEAMGGGPADLLFPEQFLGKWDVESVLTNVELPLGPEFVPDMGVVQRAQREDLQQRVHYQVGFIRNGRGEVVPDRRFNTASLMQTYLGQPESDVAQRIRWNPDDPNLLQMNLPGGLEVVTRVMRRSEEQPASDRLDTSEYFQQLIDGPSRPRPKVKGSQCFTKYRWRSAEQAAADKGPLIVATQVVSDYLTGYDDPGLLMRAGNKPVTIYTYRMAFWRAAQ